MRILLTVVLIASIGFGHAQDGDKVDKKFFFGLNLGGYFANKNTAGFYNGTTTYDGGITGYGLPYIFSGSNVYYQQQLAEQFQYPYALGIDYAPVRMRYKPGISIGGHIGLKLSDNIAMVADLDIVNLKLADVFIIEVDDPNNNQIGPTYTVHPIIGEEKRLNMNLGWQVYLSKQNNTISYWSFGVNATRTKFVDNEVIIGTMQPIRVVDPLWYQNGGVKPGGFGLGGFSGFGVKWKFNDDYIFDFGGKVYYTTINLSHPSVKDPDDMIPGLQSAIYLRIIRG